MTDPHIARQMWTRFEPIHAVTYFTPEARAAYEAAGLRGYWRGYFAGRCAPLGAVDAAPVIACFYRFAPAMVHRAIPDVWTRATPAQTLAARRDGAAAALARMLATVDSAAFDAAGTDSPTIDAAAIDEAATLAEATVDLLDLAGCVLGAANAAVSRDDGATPLARLWQSTTTFREHRGDGHGAALLAYGFDGCESVVWRCAPQHREEMRQYRGWTDGEWDAAVARLTARGWLDASGAHTPAGDDAYAAVEAATDRAAARVWHRLGEARTTRLRDLLTPLAVAAYAAIPPNNPVGNPPPIAA